MRGSAALGQIKADALERPVIHLAHDSAPVGVGLLAAGPAGFAGEARAALAANLGPRAAVRPAATGAGGSIEPATDGFSTFAARRR